MNTNERSRERRLRRAANRQGLNLHKSARRDRFASDYGVYWLTRDVDGVDWRERGPVLGGQTGVTLTEVERYLTEPR